MASPDVLCEQNCTPQRSQGKDLNFEQVHKCKDDAKKISHLSESWVLAKHSHNLFRVQEYFHSSFQVSEGEEAR